MDNRVIVGLGVLALLGVLFWPSGSSQKVRTLFEEGEQFLAAKNYQNAIPKYEEALAEADKPFVKTEVIDPDFKTLAQYKIAFCYTQIAETTGDITKYDDAIAIVEPLYARATLPKHRELITFLWGYVLYKQQKFEAAEPKFREVIENFPNSLYLENAWYSIGQLNYQLAEYDKARTAFKQIVDGFPNSDFRDDAQHLIGQSFLIERNWEQSFREFDILNRQNFGQSPLVPEAQYKAAHSLLQLDRLEEAIDRYNRFVAGFPESEFVTAAYFDLGWIYTRQKDYDNAIQNYQLAIDNTQDMALRAEIQYEIGDNYIEAQDYINAADAYRKVVEVYPTSKEVPAARFGIGEAYMKLAQANSKGSAVDEENYGNAIAAYQDVISEHPGSEYEPHATFQIGEAYYQTKDYESAVKWYDTVMERFPNDELAAYALYGALWSLSELGRHEEVLARGRAFIEQHKADPDFDLQSAEIQMKLGDIMFERENYALAVAEYGKALAYPELPKFYAVRLRSLFQQGLSYVKQAEQTGDKSLYQQAVSPFGTAIGKFSGDVFNMDYEFPEREPLVENSVLNKALAHEQLGEWESARQAYGLVPRVSENYGRARVLSAETYEKEKNINEAINRYRAISQDTTLSETWQSLGAIRLADLLRNEERYEEAAAAYENVATRYVQSEYVDAARYLVGLCYYSIEPSTEETLRRSIAAFRVVVEQFPKSVNAPDAQYGIVLSTKALAEKGLANWEEVVTLADQLTTTYADRTDERAQKAVNSGNLLKVLALEKMGAGNVDEMVRRLRDVVASQTADESARATAQLKLGNLLFEAERYLEAAPEYERLGELFPNNQYVGLAYYQAAVSHYKHGEKGDGATAPAQFTRAVELAQNAAQKDADNKPLLVSIYYTLGLAQAKVNQTPNAIDSLKQVAALEPDVQDPEKKAIIAAAHIELARLYSQVGLYNESAAEYDLIAQTSGEPDTQARAYLAIADIFENKAKDAPKAISAYQSAAAVAVDPAMEAQALYRSGLLLIDEKRNDDATRALEALLAKFGDSADANVQLMIADAGVRLSDVFRATGRVNEAIARAIEARDRAMAVGTPPQKAQAQYQLASLRALRARDAFDETPNSANTEYKRLAREAIQEFLEVENLAKPVEQAPENVRVFVGPALFQAGAFAYAIHGPQDLPIVTSALERFVDYHDRNLSPAEDSDLKTALYYVGATYYDLARGSNMDKNLFARSAATLTRLVQRFPSDREAGLWQYQIGEAHFAAEEFQRAVTAYLAVVDRYPNSPQAAEALYSAAHSYGYLQNTQQYYATWERLARQYPNSEFAGEANLYVANARFNDAAAANLTDAQKVARLKQALALYRAILGMRNAKDEVKQQAQGYIRETEELVAMYEYQPIEDAQNRALGLAGTSRQQALRQVIQRYEQLIRDYPSASSAEIAMTKIGDSYTALESWQEALSWYDRLLRKYVDARGRPIIPENEYVSRAVNYARAQFTLITNYVAQTQAQQTR